ncbi:MAG: hypothetical protein IT381_27755 [Deltaproteobacteria bacterium]|nr:hypothetical protein [Deltaproteobacteria bacterium]
MIKHASIVLLCLFACRPPPRPDGAPHLAGKAVLVAPIVGATIKVSRLDGNVGEVIGATTTDENGDFDLELRETEGTVIVELLGASQGSTKDPLTQKELTLSLTDRFAAIVTGLKLGDSREGIVVSPWSTLIAARAQWDVESNKRSFADALSDANALFATHFGERSFFDSVPLDPTAPTNGLSTGALHGFVTTALSAMGADLSHRLLLTTSGLISTISLTQWLADDLRADGVFNGAGAKGVINILEEQNVDVEFTRALLGAAMGSFATSTDNKSGVGLGDLTAIITAMSTDVSALYGTAAAGLTSQGPGPVIRITSPTSGAEYREKTIIVGTAESAVGVAGVELALDGVPFGGGGERASTTKIIWALTQAVDDGFHALRIDAKDTHGVSSTLTVTFSSDETAPVILFGSCKAPDDRTRLVTVNFDTNDVDWDIPALDPACSATALQPANDKDAFVIHQYAELAKARKTSAVVGVVPEDHGPVSTRQNDLLVRAAIYRSGKIVGSEAVIPSAGVMTSVREITLASEVFGSALLDVGADTVLELRVIVADRQGNESSASYKLKLDLMPTPLARKDISATIPGSQRVQSFSFAGNNAHQIFDTSVTRQFGMYLAAKYAVKNVSDRSNLFKIDYEAASVTARIREWRGLVAGENTSWGLPNGLGYTTATVCGSTHATLPYPTPPPVFTTCYNDASDDVPTQGALPSNPWVLVRRNGEESCIRANDYPSFEPTQQLADREAPWRVVVADESGVPLVRSAAGEYTLQAGSIAHVSVGFDVPTFDQRTITACSPAYVGNPPVYSAALNAPLGPVSTLVGILPNRTVYNGAMGWTGNGYIDCSGIACNGPDCRSDNDQVVLRAQGTPLYEDQFLGTSCVWYRRAVRRAANITLSRMRTTSDFAIDGSFAVQTSARLSKQTAAYDSAFDLLSESFTVAHKDRATNQPPDQPIRYTKGLLP